MRAQKYCSVFQGKSPLIHFIAAFGLLLLMLKPVYANDDQLMTKKCAQEFNNAIADVQMALEENGFKVQFVQRIDIGLAKAGYHTDKYRIVFFMPEHGVKAVLLKRADLAEMFPLKVTVYRDKGNVYMLRAHSASQLDDSVPAAVRARFRAWDRQVNQVIKNLF